MPLRRGVAFETSFHLREFSSLETTYERNIAAFIKCGALERILKLGLARVTKFTGTECCVAAKIVRALVWE